MIVITFKVMDMKNELSFARKTDFKPLLESIFLGAIVGVIFNSLGDNLLVAVLFGVISFLIDSMLIYPRSLKSLYNGWRIDNNGIYYVESKNWLKKMELIYLPFLQKYSFVSLSEIKTFSIVDGANIINSQNITGGFLNQPPYRRGKFLLIETNQCSKLLNLSWNCKGGAITAEEIDQLLAILKNSSR